jgi:hypothetical protein
MIELDELRDAVTSIANTDPDKVARCKYVIGGTPECLMSVYLHDVHGVHVDTLAEFDVAGGDRFGVVARRLGLEVSSDAYSWGNWVQMKQDRGLSWSEAVRATDGLYS